MKLRFSLLFVLCLVLIQTHGQTVSKSQKTPLTMEEAVLGQYGRLSPERLEQAKWIKGTDNYMYVKDNTVWMSAPKQKAKPTALLTLDELNSQKGGKTLSRIPEITWLNSDAFYFETDNSFYEGSIKQKKLTQLCRYSDDFENSDYHSASHQLAYTKGNDLFILSGEKETRITENPKDVVSGQSISRNEYGISKGTFWSSDGSRLAFYQKDESLVANYPIIDYTVTPAAVHEIKYPFAGMPSELVSVGVYNVKTREKIFLKPKNSEGDRFYLTNLAWGPDNKTIYIAWLNRETTDMHLIAFDSSTGEEIKTLFSEHDDIWVEPQYPVEFVPTKTNQFIWLSRRDGFTNAYLYNTDGKELGHTDFRFDITDIIGFDKKGENLFVSATGENPTNLLCYKISLKNMRGSLMTQVDGVHGPQISGSGNYLLDSYSNLKTPRITEIIDSKGKLVSNLLVSDDPLTNKLIGRTELFTIKSNDGSELWCRLIKPSDFDASKKYPVVVYVYNGPHVQLVRNGFLGGSALWMNYLAEKGYLVFTLDGHGSANRGREFEQVIHRQLGTREIEDQITGVDWLKKQPYVDADRLAIHGWSYGGFMTTSLMLRTPGTFKVGVAGGPVIDWRLYEVMYCERYMDTPDENPEGFKTADLTGYVKNLQGDLLMIHGMDDPVVVMQHNVNFLKACVDNGVQVDFFMYPGHEHNVRGKDRVHLITKIIDYITERL